MEASAVSDDDEYRFYPEDFDGDSDPTDRDFEMAPLVIVCCLGVGVVLFLSSPVIGPFTVVGAEIDLAVLSAAVFAVGLFVGSSVYVRQGRYRLGLVHTVGATGMVLLVVGTTFSYPVALVTGAGVLAFGAGVLIVLGVRSWN